MTVQVSILNRGEIWKVVSEVCSGTQLEDVCVCVPTRIVWPGISVREFCHDYRLRQPSLRFQGHEGWKKKVYVVDTSKQHFMYME